MGQQIVSDTVHSFRGYAGGLTIIALMNGVVVGLGAVVVGIFTTAALDITGLLTATLFAVAGWLLIPARRKRLIRELEEKIAAADADTHHPAGRPTQ